MVLRSHNIRNGRLDLADVSFTDGEHFRDRNRRIVPRAGDLVMTREAPMGEVCMLPPDLQCCLGQRMVLLRPDAQRVDGRYLLYALQSKSVRDQILWNDGTGSTVSNMRIPVLGALRVPTPSLPSQRAIARILGALDDKIELNRKMNETLEQMARAIFKSWFVDFEPFRDKGMVDSGLGRIPKGWEAKRLADVIDVNPSRTLRKGTVATYVDMQNMPTSGHGPLGWIARPFGSGTRFVNGDTLLARITPCLENGKTAYVDFLPPGQTGWGSTEYIVLRPKSPYPPEFGYLLARDQSFREHAIQNMTGSSGRQRVPPESLHDYMLPKPPDDTAEEFGRVVSPLFSQARANDGQSRTLAAIRDALLPKLISGEVRVKEVAA
jgi:type I restriction enzyme S subunit